MNNSPLQNFVNHPFAAEIATGVIVTGLVLGGGALCHSFDLSVKNPFDLSGNKVLHQIIGETPKSNILKIQIK